jgi:hypothetical protein
MVLDRRGGKLLPSEEAREEQVLKYVDDTNNLIFGRYKRCTYVVNGSQLATRLHHRIHSPAESFFVQRHQIILPELAHRIVARFTIRTIVHCGYSPFLRLPFEFFGPIHALFRG